MNIDISVNLIYIISGILIAIFLFLLHNFGGLRLFVRKDECIAKQFLDKFSLVTPEFMAQTAKLQNIENNQEIHEINKRLEALEQTIGELRRNG